MSNDIIKSTLVKVSRGCSDLKICSLSVGKKDVKSKNNKTKTSSTLNSSLVSDEISYRFQNARTDKRISLNCSPLVRDTESQDYIQRLSYVLGNGEYTLKTGQTIYGFLNSTLSKSCGLIFPYTPIISFEHSVNYDRTEITHSNLAISHYKNTPPPSISIDATFTADTRENALHMLSAIWFLRAVTKCDFGERAYVDSNAVPGMPPPILYLNGYNSIMDNIPVVVTGFSYSLPKDKHYVPLGINLDSNVQNFKDNQLDSSDKNKFSDSFKGTAAGNLAMKYLNGIANSIKSLKNEGTVSENNRYNGLYFHNWLPTEMTIRISLQIQPNLLKYKKKFNLDWYKMGLLNLDDYKGGSVTYVASKSGPIKISNDCDDPVLNYEVELEQKKTLNESAKTLGSNALTSLKNGWINTKNMFKDEINQEKKYSYEDISIKKTIVKKQAAVKDVNNVINSSLGLSQKSKTYVFDKSGWTW